MYGASGVSSARRLLLNDRETNVPPILDFSLVWTKGLGFQGWRFGIIMIIMAASKLAAHLHLSLTSPPALDSQP